MKKSLRIKYISLSCFLSGFLCLFFLCSSLAATYDPFNPENRNHPILADLKEKILPLLKQASPEASCSLIGNNYSLSCKLLPQKFMIHAINKTGEIAKEAHAQVGPSARGLIIQMTIYDPQFFGQAQIIYPWERKDPYWTTLLDYYPLNENATLHTWISYGVLTDPEMINTIKNIIRQEAAVYKQPVDQ